MLVDFRGVYAVVPRDWLHVDPGSVLAGDFEPLRVLNDTQSWLD